MGKDKLLEIIKEVAKLFTQSRSLATFISGLFNYSITQDISVILK